MPTATETPWGHWGQPSPTPAWTDAPPKLHGETGGLLKPRYEDTLKWYYKRATNQSDKEHCVKLLTQFQVQSDAKRLKRSTRPQTAPRRLRQDQIPEKPKVTLPPAAIPITNAEQIKRDAYLRQLQSIQRLSRPKSRPCSSRQAIIRSERAKDYKTCPRPKSAMADIGRRRVNDPYLTTHESEFPGYPTDLYAEATRPMSSKGFTAPYQIGDPIGGTTCQDEFSWKTCKQVDPIRSGTSSGNRKNNPHPHESFMVWRLPNKTADGMLTSPAKHLGYRDLSNDVLDQIMKDQLKSTYQNDYLGIPQGYQMKDAIDAPKDWRASVRRPKDTTVRHSYGKPEQQAELAGNTSRYGCNKKKMISALGAVPTVTKDHVLNRELIKGKTSYETAFRPGCSQPDLDKLLKAQTNQKVLDRFLRYSKIELNEERKN